MSMPRTLPYVLENDWKPTEEFRRGSLRASSYHVCMTIRKSALKPEPELEARLDCE